MPVPGSYVSCHSPYQAAQACLAAPSPSACTPFLLPVLRRGAAPHHPPLPATALLLRAAAAAAPGGRWDGFHLTPARLCSPMPLPLSADRVKNLTSQHCSSRQCGVFMPSLCLNRWYLGTAFWAFLHPRLPTTPCCCMHCVLWDISSFRACLPNGDVPVAPSGWTNGQRPRGSCVAGGDGSAFTISAWRPCR